MESQRTIRRKVSIEGVGLHTGEPVTLTLSPAASDTGILFRAADGTLIPANTDHVVNSHFATTIGAFGVRARPAGHLLAAAPGPGAQRQGLRGGAGGGGGGNVAPAAQVPDVRRADPRRGRGSVHPGGPL